VTPIPKLLRRARIAYVLALAVLGASFATARAPQFDSAQFQTPQPTSFAQCPHFFSHGRPPAIAPRDQFRELCYEAFAVLHSGKTKTPVYVAQRLNGKMIKDADEKRADKFFADAVCCAASAPNWRTSSAMATAVGT